MFARVKKMEQLGVLNKFAISINPTALDRNLCAFIRIVVMDSSSAKAATQLEKKTIDGIHRTITSVVLKSEFERGFSFNS